jgi:hypothetical protein
VSYYTRLPRRNPFGVDVKLPESLFAIINPLVVMLLKSPYILSGFVAELNKHRFNIMMEVLGSQGLGWQGDEFTERELSTTREWLRSNANSIEGGTSKIQLNIIAKRGLGLPD